MKSIHLKIAIALLFKNYNISIRNIKIIQIIKDKTIALFITNY